MGVDGGAFGGGGSSSSLGVIGVQSGGMGVGPDGYNVMSQVGSAAQMPQNQLQLLSQQQDQRSQVQRHQQLLELQTYQRQELLRESVRRQQPEPQREREQFSGRDDRSPSAVGGGAINVGAGGSGRHGGRRLQYQPLQQLASPGGEGGLRPDVVALGGSRGGGSVGGGERWMRGREPAEIAPPGYPALRILSFVRQGLLDGVVDPGVRANAMVTQPPATCIIVWVPLIHVSLYYDDEWQGVLYGWGTETVVNFLEQLAQCERGWEKVYPHLFRNWAMTIGRSRVDGVRRARGEVGTAVMEMLRAAQAAGGAHHQPRDCVLLLPFPHLQEFQTARWAPYHHREVQEACVGALDGSEMALMETCLFASLGITGEVVCGSGAGLRGETLRDGERGGLRAARFPDDNGVSGGRVAEDSCHRQDERSRGESIQEATNFPERFMVYMTGLTDEFVPLERVVLHPREQGQVDVRATGMRGRWVTVPEGAIQRLRVDSLGKGWSEAGFGPCPFPMSRSRETLLSVSREEYAGLRQLVREAASPESLVEGLRDADPNVRAMMVDRFGIDVWSVGGAVEQVVRIGLRGIAAELDTWERGVICFSSPNPAPRKMRVVDTGGRTSGGGGHVDGPDMSGVRTRLFTGTPGGGALSFATPPHFATYSGGGYDRSPSGDDGGAHHTGSVMLEKAMAVMMQHSMLTRQDLAHTNAAVVEALGRHGRSTDASDGGVQGMAVQQAALDNLRP